MAREHNVVQIAKSLRGDKRLRWNVLAQRTEMFEAEQGWIPVNDADCTLLVMEHGGRPASVRQSKIAVELAAKFNKTNPIRDYLDHQLPTWDRVERCKNLISVYFNGRGSSEQLLADASIAWMIGAVHRVIRPGQRLACLPLSIGYNPIEGLEALSGDQAYSTTRPDRMASMVSQWLVSVPAGNKAWMNDILFSGVDSNRKSCTRRWWTPWAWCSQRPPMARAYRYAEYVAWQPPALNHLRQDRSQLWAEARYLAYTYKPSPAPREPNLWLDLWAPVIHKHAMAKFEKSEMVTLKELQALFGYTKSRHQVTERLCRLMAFTTGSQRKKPRRGIIRSTGKWIWERPQVAADSVAPDRAGASHHLAP